MNAPKLNKCGPALAGPVRVRVKPLRGLTFTLVYLSLYSTMKK
jgi:hypothetical protein